MVARFTNLAPGPPLRWQRGLIGMALDAVPCAFEGLLGFLLDAADRSDYYSRKRSELFSQRPPVSHLLWHIVLSKGGWKCYRQWSCNAL